MGHYPPGASVLAADMEMETEMDTAATPPAEIRTSQKRENTDGAANTRELKRHRSNQQLLSTGACIHVSQKSVCRDKHVYQSGSSRSNISPDHGRELPPHPSTDNVTPGGTRGAYCNGSAQAGNVRGLRNTAQTLSPNQARLSASIGGNARFDSDDASTHIVSLPGQQGLGSKTLFLPSNFSPSECAVSSSTQACDQRLLSLTPQVFTSNRSTRTRTCTSSNLPLSKPPNGSLFPSPPNGGEDPSSEKPEATESEQEPELDSILSCQGRVLRNTNGALLSPEEESDSPSQGCVQAHEFSGASSGEEPGPRYPRAPSLPSSAIPNATDPFHLETTNLSSLGPGKRTCGFFSQDASVTGGFQDADSDVQEASARGGSVEDVSEIDTNDDNSEVSVCEDNATSSSAFKISSAKLLSLESRHLGLAKNVDYGDNDSGSGKSSQVSNGPATQTDEDQDIADGEIAESSEDTDDADLAALIQKVGIGHSDSEGFESDPDPASSLIAFRSRVDACSTSEDEDLSVAEIDTDGDDEDAEEGEVEYLSGLGESDSSEDEETALASDMTTNSTVSPKTNTPGRRRFTSEERELIRKTREIGACVRCRFQKIKCHPDLNNPTGKCKTCKRFSKTSPKTIHRVPCLRLRITDIVLYRSGGLNLTRRWKSIEMRDIPDRLVMSPLTIEISQNLCEKPFFIEVVRFIPREGDVTARFWTKNLMGKETTQKKELEPYCLLSIHDTADKLRQYIIDNALSSFLHTVQLDCESEPESGLIMKTYLTVMSRYMTLHKEQSTGKKLSQDEEKEVGILGNLFILWCAIQYTVGSLHINGKETLGMAPETVDKTYPLYGKVSVPRMIVAQFDTLNYNGVLERYKEKLLKDIDWLFSQDKSRWWFTIYLIVFVLLRETSRMTADRYRHARANHGSKLRYSIPAFVEGLHDSCNNILTHWHYYNCNIWPRHSSIDNKRGDHFENLATEQLNLVRQTRKAPEVKKHLSIWKRYKAENGKVDKITLSQDAGSVRYIGKQDKFDWDHPLYWVAQMFEKDWYPHPTYQQEPLPKKTLTAAIAVA
ncbi:hypothetical protein FAVG1_06126 [Fusarium avenaceum]|nr:hypothetical protein FAVG1_06126 [Fusarium avenaceum]